MRKLVLFFMLFLLLAWCNSHISKHKQSLINESFIKENLDEKNWYLDLSNKNYDKIPDICSVKTTPLLEKVKELNLSHNNIKTVNQDLSCLKNLEILNLSYNKISDFVNLWNPEFLHTIDLSHNNLTNLDNLKKYPKVAHLNLSYNKVKNISSLKDLKNLRVLKLQYNQISNLSWFENLNQLIFLDLSYNKISDKYQLRYLKNLHSLKQLYLKWNSLEERIIKTIEDYSKKHK